LAAEQVVVTEQNPAITAADALALRLIMSMLNKDIDLMDNTVTAITAAAADNPRNLSYVCLSLATHTVSTLKTLSKEAGDPEFGIRIIEGLLQKALDGDV
jgi:hypothetical protein